MIWESSPWKKELRFNARSLIKWSKRRRSKSRSFQIERLVFLSACIMRKLWEARKLSTAWGDQQVSTISHPAKGKRSDRLNWHKIDKHYHLDRPNETSLNAIELCNRISHSYVFVESSEKPKSVAGFFFASDKTKRHALWYVALDDFAKLLKETGRDYPTSSHWVRHSETGEWIDWSGHGSPPEEWTKFAEAMAKQHVAKLSGNNPTGQ